MKRLALFLFLAASVLLSQTRTQTKTGITVTGDSTDIPNLASSPAIGWRLDWFYTGGSCTGVTIQLDCAPDNGSGAPGTYAACAGAVDGTVNPVTISATPQAGTIALKTYTPHIAVNPTNLSGSGCSVNWNLTGLFGAANVPSALTTTVISNGQVTSTGTAGNLGNNVVKSVCVRAGSGNGGSIYVGNSSVTTSNGFELPASSGTCLNVINTNLVYVVGSGTLSWIGVNY